MADLGLVVKFDDEHQTMIYSIRGPVLEENVPQLAAEINQQLLRKAKNFVLVFEPSSQVKVRAIDGLLRIRDNIREAFGKLRIVDVGEHIPQLRFTGLSNLIVVVRTLPCALKSLEEFKD